MPDNVICGKNHDKSSDMESAGLFVLKHKDLDVAMAQMDVMTGALETVVAVYLPEEMPPGIRRAHSTPHHANGPHGHSRTGRSSI